MQTSGKKGGIGLSFTVDLAKHLTKTADVVTATVEAAGDTVQVSTREERPDRVEERKRRREGH